MHTTLPLTNRRMMIQIFPYHLSTKAFGLRIARKWLYSFQGPENRSQVLNAYEKE